MKVRAGGGGAGRVGGGAGLASRQTYRGHSQQPARACLPNPRRRRPSCCRRALPALRLASRLGHAMVGRGNSGRQCNERAVASQVVGTELVVAALPRVSEAEPVSSVRLTLFRQGVSISLTWLPSKALLRRVLHHQLPSIGEQQSSSSSSPSETYDPDATKSLKTLCLR